MQNIVQISAGYRRNGKGLISDGFALDADNQSHGVRGLLGVIYVAVEAKCQTEAAIIDQMAIAYPWLGRSFHRTFLELLTGGDPATHLLRKLSDDTYEIISVLN
jgi:hypothetical protein